MHHSPFVRGLAAALVLAGGATAVQAQQAPPDSTVGMVGTTLISVHYRAPSVGGRQIFGTTVPYGQVWSPGGDRPAAFRTLRPLKIGDTTVPRGEYSLYVIPAEAKGACGTNVSAGPAMLVISKATGSAAAQYAQGQDLARVPLRACVLDAPEERLRMWVIPGKGDAGVLRLDWEKTRYEVPFTLAR